MSARSSDNKRRRLKDHERLVSPKTLEPSRCQFGVARRMLDRLVTQIALDRARIDALIGQLVAAGVAQHVRVDFHIEVGDLSRACASVSLVSW